MEKAISALMSLGIEPKSAEKYVMKVLRENKLDNSKDILIKALELVDKQKSTKETSNKNVEQKKSINNLKKVIETGKKEKKSAYEALSEEGLIRSPLEEFTI